MRDRNRSGGWEAMRMMHVCRVPMRDRNESGDEVDLEAIEFVEYL